MSDEIQVFEYTMKILLTFTNSIGGFGSGHGIKPYSQNNYDTGITSRNVLAGSNSNNNSYGLNGSLYGSTSRYNRQQIGY